FYREELLTGRGRLLAGDLTNELRRLYEPSVKYGLVNPLIYPVTVCPGCYFAAYNNDFLSVPKSALQELENGTDDRITSIQKIFGELDFHETRDTPEGAVSYFLALMCYDAFPREFSPVIKQGLCALRGAWLFADLHKALPTENYDYLSKLFYRKAHFFYILALDYETSGKQSITDVGHLGPDLDQNYGYDGVLYLSSYLELHHGPRENAELRISSLQRAKTTMAKLFGMGRASKEKPTAILDKARDQYALINAELEESGESGESADEAAEPDDGEDYAVT
ncbi:MAG: DUF2225 domain-containing protein, partial [Spirochaetales bacterium]|nr:DUF2225 domain-containing protein [Spirochaetales bacterium]